MHNPSLRRSLSLLTRPASILAMAILFLNDHYLRVYHPSWLTGKLGDLAWLYFCPFALAALLSLALPGATGKRPRLAILLSLALIGGTFGAANLFPGFASWLASWAGDLLGIPLRITSDPTDLAALPVLGLSCWGWARWQPLEVPSLARGGLWIGLAAALTLANSVQPDYGIICLIDEPDRLVAGSSWFQYYASGDGGLTWQEIPREESFSCDPYQDWQGELALPGSERISVRSSEKGSLELTVDGGQVWQSVTDGRQFSQAQIAWIQRTSRMFYRPGPLDAAADPASGNLVFAMGLEGVLVLEPGGTWITVPIGDYAPVRLTAAMTPFLLQYEIVLGGVLALLLIITPGTFRGKSTFQKIWLGLNWAAWLFTLLVLQPARLSGYGTIMGSMATYFTGASVLILLVVYLVKGWESLKPHLGRALATALLGWIAFCLPLVLWALDLIPGYTWAAVLAVLLGAGALAVHYRYWAAEGPEPEA